MLDILKNSWKVVEIRKKILFTLFIILIFRIGSVVPVPFINVSGLESAISGSQGVNEFFSYLSALTGAGLQYGAIFAMSVTPYINASIIMQLLTSAFPFLERIAKGEDGQKRIAKYTRFVTVILGLIQGTVYFIWLKNNGLVTDGVNIVFAAFVIILCFTAGSAIMMWMGERIDEKGIGNGISILLFAGILSRVPENFQVLWAKISTGEDIPVVILTLVLFLFIIGFIVFMTNAERRIPIQYAKRVVGRKMYGGQSTHLPIQVNMAGVMPIIFASSFLSIPSMILAFMGTDKRESLVYRICEQFSYRGIFYILLYLAMIIGFAYFYVSMQYNPLEMANNLRKNNGSVPGIRPGQPTAD
ncbi:MAG: preprotein translocase subunit SecY, partial [Clostridia bacterium]|nr:preprotein translocase subunit SecY [Clostridia bacterium]